MAVADEHLLKPLEKLGYSYLSKLEKQIPKRRYLQKLDDEGKHLVHIHILLFEGELWKNHMRFRNYLLTHLEEAQAYAVLKRNLTRIFHGNSSRGAAQPDVDKEDDGLRRRLYVSYCPRSNPRLTLYTPGSRKP